MDAIKTNLTRLLTINIVSFCDVGGFCTRVFSFPFIISSKRESSSNSMSLSRILFSDQAAEYWKQAIALTPGNYIEAQNWLKITKFFEFVVDCVIKALMPTP